jgi:hypothetical protein
MGTRQTIRFLSTASLAVVLIGGGQLGCEIRPASVRQFDDFVEERLCMGSTDTGCLEQLTHYACASGCARTGYNLRWQQPGRLDIHLTLPFLRKLRNAAQAHPEYVSRHSLGMSLEDLVWSQLQMFLTHESVRFYDTDLSLLDPGAVRTRNSVDPTRFHSVTWVNEGGTAHAMVQADLGLWLLTMARGVPEQGDWYLRLSERVFRSYAIPDEQGGVRNNRQGNRCFDNLYCYWFHSFPVGDESYPKTVLNQHLHAVRDALIAHDLLASWRDHGAPGADGQIHPLPAEFDSIHIGYLKEWGRGGLFQLAYAPGNEAIATAPPNLAEFLADADVLDGVQRYRAHYRYEIGVGPFDISPDNTCHYHYHSLQVMADALDLIATSPYFASDPYFVGVYYKLLYGRDLGDTRSCNNRSSIPPSKRVMRGVPLAELFIGSFLEQGFQLECDEGEPVKFLLGTEDFALATPFYEAAYDSCIF